MDDLSGVAFKIRNFKCFGEEEQGFDQIKPVNIIIGRNNSGKSTLLDLIDYVTKNKFDFPRELWHNGKKPEIIAQTLLDESLLKRVFPEGTRGGGIPGSSHWEFGRKLIGTKFSWQLNANQDQRFIKIGDCVDGTRPLDSVHNSNKYIQDISKGMKNPFWGKQFKIINAERNIVPEGDNKNDLEVHGDGRGVTNIIQNFINKAGRSSELVEIKLLNELNSIFNPDANFTDIVCQQLEDNKWEIYLEEEGKGRIPLSQSGSGLKTIIIVLVYIHLLPVVMAKDLSEFVFGFEELENNLHPALLRRLLYYLKEQALSNGCLFFLTTHSNVEIDLFSKSDDAQIIHVTHNGAQAYCRKVQTYIDNKGILDDLDVRASDLLQSNGIIWVEGPSDRIYLNRWIDIWSNGELKEGHHYQCVFYGGRLLSHLSSKDPNLVEDGVSILEVNRNSILLIDSDKRNKQTHLNKTKKRIIKEIQDMGGTAWVTKGKEVENYIPAEAISKWLNLGNVTQVNQYENFFEYLGKIKQGFGKKYASKKPLLAEEISPYLTKDNVSDVLDLADRVNDICEVINKWNQ